MKRPIESDYTSQAAYTRALEDYCDWLEAKPVEPVGYWDGEFSKDGGATLYEVPQVSLFGRKYVNAPLYAEPVQAKPVEPVGYVAITGHGTYFQTAISAEQAVLMHGVTRMWTPVYKATQVDPTCKQTPPDIEGHPV